MIATHPLVDDYLRQLERASRALPQPERDELIAEIRSHLDAGLASTSSEAEVRTLLDDMGPVDAIVAAARPDSRPVRRGAREVFALILLVTGLPPILGWLIGAGLLLWSPLWSTRQKVLGLLVWPGGYVFGLGVGLTAAFVGTAKSCRVPVNGSSAAASCTTSPGTNPLWPVVGVVVLIVAPLLVAAYLYRAAGRRTVVA